VKSKNIILILVQEVVNLKNIIEPCLKNIAVDNHQVTRLLLAFRWFRVLRGELSGM
jgi:hypothetical protein